jgi:hypothetical protein
MIGKSLLASKSKIVAKLLNQPMHEYARTY